MPLRLNPLPDGCLPGYGTFSAVNAGKMYITGNILNANYASDGFNEPLTQVVLYQRHLKQVCAELAHES